jgi:sulfite oxidase
MRSHSLVLRSVKTLNGRVTGIQGSAGFSHFHGQDQHHHRGHGQENSSNWKIRGAVLGSALAAGFAALGDNSRIKLQAEAVQSSPEDDKIIETTGARIEGLKEFSIEDVNKHDSPDNRVWVTFKNGVYDITDFIPMHPGADKLLMAAGSSVEPFWAMYAVHLNNPAIYGMLEKYRIGNLNVADAASQAEQMASDSSDPYSTDPARHKAIVVNSKTPFNGETPLGILTDSFITPTDLFYVRNHLPVPDVDIKDYELEVSGLGVKEINLSLEELKKLPKHKIVATVQCAGNRRAEMRATKNLKGLEWRGGAIGNAEWAGAKLCDVLKAAGLDENNESIRHVHFEGLDTDPSNSPYGASIPVEKATDPRGDVLLAYEMNGEPLNRDHGYPVRVIVPGVAGARNVKWLGKIYVSDVESDSHWQQNDYKGFNPSTDWDTVDFTKSPAIQDMPVTSSICSPAPGAKVNGGQELAVSGYAWSGGGRKIVRVDLTADGGKTWTQAESLEQDTARHPRHWGWTIWKGKVRVPDGAESAEVWSKAVDSSYNVQPETFANIWNLRGVLSNAYCRLKLSVQN